jgi:hypothetical protein
MRELTNFVDDEAINRNTEWLLSRRSEEKPGSF